MCFADDVCFSSDCQTIKFFYFIVVLVAWTDTIDMDSGSKPFPDCLYVVIISTIIDIYNCQNAYKKNAERPPDWAYKYIGTFQNYLLAMCA